MSSEEIEDLIQSGGLPDSPTMARLKEGTECVFIQHYKDPTVIVVVLALEDAGGGAIRMPIRKWFSDSPNPFTYRMNSELQTEVQLANYEWEELRSFWTETATHYS